MFSKRLLSLMSLLLFLFSSGCSQKLGRVNKMDHLLHHREIQQCVFQPPPEPLQNHNLEFCCWYKDNTCCQRNTQDLVLGLKETADYFLGVISDECYWKFSTFICYLCDPHTAHFIRYMEYRNKDSHKVPGFAEVHLCLSFCEDLYQSCKNSSISQSTSFVDASDFCTKFSSENTHFVIEEDPDAMNCFRGVDIETVKSARCESSQTSSNANDGDENADQTNTWGEEGRNQNSSTNQDLSLQVGLIGLAGLAALILGIIFYHQIKTRFWNKQPFTVQEDQPLEDQEENQKL